MVYTKVMVIYGIIVTRKQLKKTGLIDKDGYIQKYTLQINEIYPEKSIQAFPYPCCSDLACKKYIIGVKVREYYRKIKECDECGEYTCCNECIKCTERGKFDVVEILNNVVNVDNSLICRKCHNISSFEISEDSPCKFCNYNNSLPHIDTEIKSFCNQISIKYTDVKHYLMIDDCLSCT